MGKVERKVIIIRRRAQALAMEATRMLQAIDKKKRKNMEQWSESNTFVSYSSTSRRLVLCFQRVEVAERVTEPVTSWMTVERGYRHVCKLEGWFERGCPKERQRRKREQEQGG